MVTTSTDQRRGPVGIVIIGRNEGERLHHCVASLKQIPALDVPTHLVYVDSDSSDDSVAWARGQVDHVVELDPSTPLSAARARNAGLARLLEETPDLEYVQFVDGDCRVEEIWIGEALAFLRAHPKAAVACGRRREVAPESTVYNRLANLEWDTPVGLANSCGGDSLMRVSAVQAVGGFSDDLIAGEEPELCLRLRRAGHEIHRLPLDMTVHDAALTRFSQWWKRSARAGHAAIELVYRYGRESGPPALRRVRSILAWSLGPPILTLAALPLLGPFAIIFLGAYGLLATKIQRSERDRGRSPRDAWTYAVACSLGKFAELEGFARFGWNLLFRGGRNRIIEYKGADSDERA